MRVFFSRFIFVSIFFISIHYNTNVLSQGSPLNLNEIMAGNDFIGHQPNGFNWSPSSKEVYFRWNKDNKEIASYYRYSLKNESLDEIKTIAEQPLPLNGFRSNKEQSIFFFKRGNNLYQWKKGNTQLIYSKTSQYNIQGIYNNQLVLKEGNDLIAINLETQSYKQLTYFSEGSSPKEKKTLSYLEQQQLDLFRTIQMEKTLEEAQKEFNKKHSPRSISPFYLENKSLGRIEISSNLSYAVFRVDDYSSNATTSFTEHITKDGYTKSKNARSKVGGKNPSHELYLWDFERDSVLNIDFKGLSGINLIPDFYEDYPDKTPKSYSKELIYHIHGFNSTNDKCLIEIKSYDNKDRWIVYLNTDNGQFVELDHQHDEKWIGGPGITGWKSVPGNLGWVNDKNLYFQSEKTGFSHLYLSNCDNPSIINQLTKGEYEIHDVSLSKDHSTFFITANKNHPGNRSFYHLDIKSKEMTPILVSDGNHQVRISPDEKWLLINYSYKNKPWDLYLAENKAGSKMKQITKSTTASFESYDWRAPEVITFKASDGQNVNARIYVPEESKKNNAAVLFVHGAGYLQNAHNWWSGYHREFMFNNLLCDLGYTVLDIDYRASKGYGRDFRTAIYRHMGGKDLSDHLDGRKMLIDNYNIDPNKIGIYGGSYGGFISIMALLTEPGKFRCGAAIRSVTDWAHYNHPYTSNILNTPSEDPVAFKKSSPIYFADNLEDRLLMLHGMEDDNVQYQDVVRLSQRFIELGKTNWDLIGYPIEPHGFKETTSWIDEYGRILKLFQEELLDKE